MKFFAFLTLMGGVFGTFLMVGAFMADTHQAQAARAATAVGCVAIPYCMSRAIEMIHDGQIVMLSRILKALPEVQKQAQDE